MSPASKLLDFKEGRLVFLGMYTGIRFKGYVKPEFRGGFEKIAFEGKWEKHRDPILRDFGYEDRSDRIPCGMLAYMPEEWVEWIGNYEGQEIHDGFHRQYDPKTGYWAFACSLKNYFGTIDAWIGILPHFIEKIDHLEVLYEEWEYSKQYDIVDGVTTMINDKFIKYGFKEDR